MDFPWTVLVVNIVAILVLPFFAALLAPKNTKAEIGTITFIVLFILSWVSWLIYIALHFIAKWW